MGPIMIVDDDTPLREMYAEYLTGVGYQVIKAKGGREAIELALHGQPTPGLVLLDIMMEDLNGIEVLKQLRAQTSMQNVPILMITALIQELEAQAAHLAGANGYLVKSATALPKLKQIIESWKKFIDSGGQLSAAAANPQPAPPQP
ncbi:MAG: multi-sensor hybrid histidine kinase [Candidatus Berkelbacteria bacterium Gr01-1014_85]|uniref:Multi-sensor hybrid histidine kinase n=1 Tax=Candidatus Berkelbacteria bacterium Gr01-1014_85 TaxID=2017150 RepID=A0A554JA14_9BACT|nr:MAG: multi-sensor hybrid histidine kinase [Candidatus Berkelbacteria bacterium Gr01-1014_85]